MSIGTCTHTGDRVGAAPCGGPLCVSSVNENGVRRGVVVCERCGNPAKDHPLTQGEHAPYVLPREVTAVENPSTIPERVRTLELLCLRMQARIEALEAACEDDSPSRHGRKR